MGVFPTQTFQCRFQPNRQYNSLGTCMDDRMHSVQNNPPAPGQASWSRLNSQLEATSCTSLEPKLDVHLLNVTVIFQLIFVPSSWWWLQDCLATLHTDCSVTWVCWYTGGGRSCTHTRVAWTRGLGCVSNNCTHNTVSVHRMEFHDTQDTPLLALCEGTSNFDRDLDQGQDQKYNETRTGTKHQDYFWAGTCIRSRTGTITKNRRRFRS